MLSIHSSDFEVDKLAAQLLMLPTLIKEETSFSAVSECLRSQSQTVRDLLSEVCKLMKLLQRVPASAASAERSFSDLRQVSDEMSNDDIKHELACAYYFSMDF